MLGKKSNSGLEPGYIFAPYIAMTTNSVIHEYTSNRNRIRRIKINNIFDLDLDIKDEFSPSKSGGGSRGKGSSGGGSGGSGTSFPPSSPPPYTPPYQPPYVPPSTPVSGGGSSSSSTYKSYINQPRIFAPRVKLSRSSNKKYEVFVRRGGAFIKSGEGLDLKSAITKGKFAVGTSAAATFKIKDISKGTFIKSFNIGKDIRSGKKSPFEFVEKRGRRIKSSGELKEITFKGVRSSKRKKVRF
jgi:hypothetical protein